MTENSMYADLENFIQNREFESAGILLGQIINETHGDDVISAGEIEELQEGVYGETVG